MVTREEILNSVTRGGRIFLFEYPCQPGTWNLRIPDEDVQERIEVALKALPFCKSVEGPLINGMFIITIDDTGPQPPLTDNEIRTRIANIVMHEWR